MKQGRATAESGGRGRDGEVGRDGGRRANVDAIDIDVDVDVGGTDADAIRRGWLWERIKIPANMLFVHPIRSLRKRNRSQHEQVLGMYGMCDEDDAI